MTDQVELAYQRYLAIVNEQSKDWTDAERVFKIVTAELVFDRVYPSPTRIKARIGLGGQPNSINGRRCRWREEILEALGWRYVGPIAMLSSARRRSFEPPDWWVEKQD